MGTEEKSLPNNQILGRLEDTMSETKEKPLNASPEKNIKSTDENELVVAAKLEEGENVTGLRLALVIGAVTAAAFLMLLDTSIVATAIPRITSDFHSLDDIGWYGSAYLLANCALQPLTGKLYTQFGSKIPFVIFIFIFEVGSLLCGVATSSTMLIIGRAVSGLGGSGLVNGALTIISTCVPLEKRALHFGIMMGVAQLGVLIGPLLGGALTEHVSWRWCFYINLPIGAPVIALISLIHIPDNRIKSQVHKSTPAILNSLDLPGFGIFASAAVMFLLALEWGGTEYKWNSSVIIGLFCGSAAVLAVFVVWEYHRGDTAMIPLSLFRDRIVWCSCLVMFFFMANMLTTSYYMPIYFQAIKGVEPTLSGVYLLPSILSQMCIAVVGGTLIGKVGYYLPFIIVSGVVSSIGAGLLSSLKPSTSVVRWVFYQIISGVGRGCGMQIPLIAVQNAVTPELNSISMSALVFCQNFGGALFLSFAQTIFNSGLKNALPHFAPGVNATTVINAGAANLDDVVADGSLKGVLLAYNQAINHVLYLCAGCCVAVTCFGCGLGWKSVKKAKTQKIEPIVGEP